jgi:hypothetical protein
MKIYQVCGRFQHHCLREAPIDECRFASLSKSMTFRPFHRIEPSSDRSKVLRANDEPMYRADNTLEQQRVYRLPFTCLKHGWLARPTPMTV